MWLVNSGGDVFFLQDHNVAIGWVVVEVGRFHFWVGSDGICYGWVSILGGFTVSEVGFNFEWVPMGWFMVARVGFNYVDFALIFCVGIYASVGSWWWW